MQRTLELRQSEGQRVLDEQQLTEALCQAVGLDDHVAQARPFRDQNLCCPDLLTFIGVQEFLIGVDPRLALRLPCAGRHTNPVEFALEGLLTCRLGLFFLAETLLLLLEPRRIVAFPWDPLTTVQLEDPFRDVVEEVAVVADDNGAACKVEQRVLERVLRALGVAFWRCLFRLRVAFFGFA